MEGIIQNAATTQDNVLLEYQSNMIIVSKLTLKWNRYECALIMNKLYGIPVFPIFIAEISDGGSFSKFSTAVQFPKTEHCRGDFSQARIEELMYVIMDLTIVINLHIL